MWELLKLLESYFSYLDYWVGKQESEIGKVLVLLVFLFTPVAVWRVLGKKYRFLERYLRLVAFVMFIATGAYVFHRYFEVGLLWGLVLSSKVYEFLWSD
ncbi:hypothetical protein [Aquifex aeolicus]|uniref:hypothetical protein n=1 Tax=Aquifex aeolicus TaxID=63363 RepID=UPI000312F927|nr:hypothetical protein [Aquifex aeolicus]